MKGTSATLFVDDYVSGRVPDICSVSGEPTTDRVITSTEIDGPSLGWLFLLLFPVLGWLILVLVMAFSRRSYLRGAIPISEASYLAARSQRRRWYGALALGIVLLFAGAYALRDVAQLGGVTVLIGLAVAVAAGVALVRVSTGVPRITLDASRRWVTLHRVHPAFAEAAERHDHAVGHLL